MKEAFSRDGDVRNRFFTLFLPLEGHFSKKDIDSGIGGNLNFKTSIKKIANFKCDYLDNGNDSEFTVKTKNAPFFMNFPNIYKLWQISLI